MTAYLVSLFDVDLDFAQNIKQQVDETCTN